MYQEGKYTRVSDVSIKLYKRNYDKFKYVEDDDTKKKINLK